MDLLLKISDNEQNLAWEESQCLPTPSARFQAYINRLAMFTVVPWIEETLSIKTTQQSCWELVNGTAITLEQTRLILIPTDAIDTTEIRIPQEWIDIPSWVADYYLAVQVNTEDGVVRIWGYTTHLQVKQQGNYHPGDRTYSLDAQFLTRDINLLWITHQLCPTATTKSVVTPLPHLPLAQAHNLLTRLGNPTLAFPRRAVPFSLWGALLEHGGWRQRLYELRLGLAEQWSMIQWAQNKISDLAKQIGWDYLGLKAVLPVEEQQIKLN